MCHCPLDDLKCIDDLSCISCILISKLLLLHSFDWTNTIVMVDGGEIDDWFLAGNGWFLIWVFCWQLRTRFHPEADMVIREYYDFIHSFYAYSVTAVHVCYINHAKPLRLFFSENQRVQIKKYNEWKGGEGTAAERTSFCYYLWKVLGAFIMLCKMHVLYLYIQSKIKLISLSLLYCCFLYFFI